MPTDIPEGQLTIPEILRKGDQLCSEPWAGYVLHYETPPNAPEDKLSSWYADENQRRAEVEAAWQDAEVEIEGVGTLIPGHWYDVTIMGYHRDQTTVRRNCLYVRRTSSHNTVQLLFEQWGAKPRWRPYRPMPINELGILGLADLGGEPAVVTRIKTR